MKSLEIDRGQLELCKNKFMDTIVQENQNIPLKFDAILFQVMILCCSFISLYHISSCITL